MTITTRTDSALGRTGPHRHRAVHGHPRRCDRERRAALDQDGSRLLGDEPAVGDLRLRDLFGGTLLLGGRLADLLGRRRLFAAGLALFTASSLLCGLAWSEASLIGFRALQGLGGALLAPAALSLLMTTFAEGRDRNIASGSTAPHRERRGRRRPAGRPAHLVPELVVDLLHQRAGRPSPRSHSHLCCSARAARSSPRATSTSPARSSVTGGLMLLVYATTRAPNGRLGRCHHARAVRQARPRSSSRSSSSSSARGRHSCRCGSSGCAR